MTTMLRLARGQRGFTLAELLVVMAILGLMLSGLVTVQMAGQTAYLVGAHRVEAQQNGRVALELMVRELRSACSVTAIPSATDMTFNVDQSGVNPPCQAPNLTVLQYQLSGTTLNRTATGCGTCTGVATPVIGGVQTFTLTYYKYDPLTNQTMTTTQANQVKLVRVQLVTGTEETVASYSAANQQATIESLVQLRNM
jgi:prepilin-type N-terminal cleavage/methylation domain-containing protein